MKYCSFVISLCVCATYVYYIRRYLKQRKAADPVFVNFIEQIRGAERHTLESLLRLPISRIWDYDKLVDHLMSVTPDGHPDYSHLKKASMKLHTVCLLHHLFVCVCACMCVCVHLYMHVCVCVCTYVHAYVCVCEYICTCMCVCALLGVLDLKLTFFMPFHSDCAMSGGCHRVC